MKRVFALPVLVGLAVIAWAALSQGTSTLDRALGIVGGALGLAAFLALAHGARKVGLHEPSKKPDIRGSSRWPRIVLMVVLVFLLMLALGIIH